MPSADDELQNTLSEQMKSGWQSNPAMKTLINDYARYHAVLVVAGGCVVLTFALLSIVFWTKFKRMPEASRRNWAFEKKVYLSFGFLSSVVALCLGLLVAANATNAFDPRSGFSLLVGSLPPSGNSVDRAELRDAFYEWIQSGSDNAPSVIEQRIHERVAFHTTKAVVCGMLLIGFVAISMGLWSALVKRARVNESKQRFKEGTLFVSGVATVALSLLMMVIVLANMQGAFAPLTLTLLYG